MYLYLLKADYFTYNKKGQLQEAFKIGTTKNPSKRLDSYRTSHASSVGFKYLFHLNNDEFQLENDLYRLDAIKFPLYLTERNLEYLHCDRGGGKEWYWNFEDIDYEKILTEFLSHHNIIFTKEQLEYKQLRTSFLDFEELKEDLQKKLDLKFRLPQLRLWDHFVNLSRNDSIRGILEWMMGTGKTIAALEMLTIALAREQYLKGLIVSHRKDILEQFSSLAKILNIPIFRRFGKYKEDPQGESYLFFISHQGLINYEIPSINFFLYDEVHRISGDELNNKLKNYLTTHEIKYLLGLSATPIINSKHKEYIQNIFGLKINILDTCDYVEAVKLKIIAPLKFHLIQREKNLKPLEIMVNSKDDISEFLTQNALVSCPSTKDDRDDAFEFFEDNFDVTCYLSRKDFEQDVQSNIKCLFSCRTYQEGTDLKNLGLSFIFAGDTIEPYIIFQIAGRTTRLDYEHKEAQCVLFWTGDIKTIRSLVKYLGRSLYKNNIEERKLYEEIIGSIKFDNRRTISGEDFFKELTDPSIRFDRLRTKIISRGITDLGQYELLMKNDYDYVENPQKEFAKFWQGEAHFFGLPEEIMSLNDILKKCKELSITNLSEYEEYSEKGILPKRPNLYYYDFMNSFYEDYL